VKPVEEKPSAESHSDNDVRIAVVGNVDSGKSTLVGVLTRNCLDDGRGKARQKVFSQQHELASGRTSAIG
jgi:GTPase